MRDRTNTLMLAGALLCACGDPPTVPPADAGADASATDDGGPGDGGVEPDGGSEPTRGEVLAQSRDDLAAVDTAVLAIPAGMRETGAFLQLQLVEVRLDAIIGEKGSGAIDLAAIIGEKGTTLSLRPISIQALVVAQQLDAAIRELDAMIESSVWGASGDPDLATLETACITLRDGLLSLRDRLWLRFGELVDTTVLTPRDEPSYVDSRAIELVAGATAIDVVVEGRSAAEPTATIETSCASFPTDVRVIDSETGEELVPTTSSVGGVPNVVEVDLGHDDVRVLRVEVSTTDGSGWTPCTVTISGRRRFRGARETIDTIEASAIASADADWSAAAGGIASQIAMASPTGPLVEDRVASLESFARDATAAVSRLRTHGRAGTVDEEDYEIHQLTLQEVILPMSDALLADPGISSDAMLTPHLDTWRRVIGELLAETAPGHAGAL